MGGEAPYSAWFAPYRPARACTAGVSATFQGIPCSSLWWTIVHMQECIHCSSEGKNRFAPFASKASQPRDRRNQPLAHKESLYPNHITSSTVACSTKAPYKPTQRLPLSLSVYNAMIAVAFRTSFSRAHFFPFLLFVSLVPSGSISLFKEPPEYAAQMIYTARLHICTVHTVECTNEKECWPHDAGCVSCLLVRTKRRTA